MAKVFEVVTCKSTPSPGSRKASIEQYRFFYGIEGDAIQAARRSADEFAREQQVDFKITKWSDDSLEIEVDGAGSFCTVVMTAHPVL